MTAEDRSFKWEDMKPEEQAQARALGLPTLLVTRIAMQNLIHPAGQRYQDDFQTCLDEIKHFAPELEGLTFFHPWDISVEVKNDHSKVIVSFEARKVTPEEAASYGKPPGPGATLVETQKDIKADGATATVTN